VVELKEAEKTSLKESERIDKEIVELKEMKVRRIFTGTELHYLEHSCFGTYFHHPYTIFFIRAEKDQHDDSR
jgi:F-type H+-transporting ATPase subunit d